MSHRERLLGAEYSGAWTHRKMPQNFPDGVSWFRLAPRHAGDGRSLRPGGPQSWTELCRTTSTILILRSLGHSLLPAGTSTRPVSLRIEPGRLHCQYLTLAG